MKIVDILSHIDLKSILDLKRTEWHNWADFLADYPILVHARIDGTPNIEPTAIELMRNWDQDQIHELIGMVDRAQQIDINIPIDAPITATVRWDL